jgi:D-aminopeptidase
MRARELGLACGSLSPGEHDSIADVPRVTVGHAILIKGDVCTGVTAVLPHEDDLFADKPVAAAEAVLHALAGAGTTEGRRGHRRVGLRGMI